MTSHSFWSRGTPRSWKKSRSKMSSRSKNLHRRMSSAGLLLAVVLFFGFGPAVKARQNRSNAEIDKRVEALLGKLTLEEKITLIGGINDFYTRPISRIGIPSFRISGGPTGVHDYRP